MFGWCKPEKQTQPETAQAANQKLSQATMESAAAIITCDTCGREIDPVIETWIQHLDSGKNFCFDCERVDRERKDQAFKEAFDEAIEKQNRPTEMPIGCALPPKTAYMTEDNDFCEEPEIERGRSWVIQKIFKELQEKWIIDVTRRSLPTATKLDLIEKIIDMGVV